MVGHGEKRYLPYEVHNILQLKLKYHDIYTCNKTYLNVNNISSKDCFLITPAPTNVIGFLGITFVVSQKVLIQVMHCHRTVGISPTQNVSLFQAYLIKKSIFA